ncbi:MAG: crossover junction endodeoxyribonuclease RuvC [Oscillospiraceae bacterium]|nr:crossover junction endodeoxyribonuclease RuvC [Oscillospiraceae bacterium]
MRILGIDPGIADVGFGIVDSKENKQTAVTWGVIRTIAGTSLSSRLDRIFCDLTELISAFSPDVMAVEELFFNTNITTGISVAHGRGVILLAGCRSLIPIKEYTPLQVKLAVTGYGRADKNQVQDMVRRILKMKSAPKPDDAADALAVALCHARSSASLLDLEGVQAPCSTT